MNNSHWPNSMSKLLARWRVLAPCLALALALLPAASPALAGEEPREIRLATPAWHNLTNPDGSGLYFDLLRRVYQPAGVKVSFRIVPWKRAKSLVVNGKADAMPAAYLTPPGKGWVYPKHPMDLDVVMALFKGAGGPPWRGAASLRDCRVLWLRGYNFQDYLKQPTRWEEVDSAAQGLAMLRSDRADFYLDIAGEVRHLLATGKDAVRGLRAEKVFTIDTYLRFSDRPASRRLMNIWDKGMKRLLDSAELTELFKRWGRSCPRLAASP